QTRELIAEAQATYHPSKKAQLQAEALGGLARAALSIPIYGLYGLREAYSNSPPCF
ncbi:MAG: hypothetical protein GWO24_21970, partial [Akkermansiaceae bacterium]|nr:hypothetical protein [Akkermansiaceae bacterium]